MKKLSNLLNEVKGEKAHREAVAMGLKYKGFGYWVDPSTGETKYKTENDQLVAVDPDVESSMADKSADTADMAGGGGNPMGAMGTGMQMQQPGGTMPQVGQLPLGAPEPGKEIAPNELEWEPGPDGSTCVDSDKPPAEVPEDSYVSTKNNLKWGAGPDGTNYTNIDYAEYLKKFQEPNLMNFLQRKQAMEDYENLRQTKPTIGQFMSEAPMQAGMGSRSAADEAHQRGYSYMGYGYWRDSSGSVVAQTQDGKLVMLDQGMQGGGTPATTDMGNPTSGASGMTPADKARSMGLASNGSGGYVDQEGNVIARTVNNELVFYDSRAGGGAVSDGSGGAMLTQSAPSWVDPVTGLIIVPPAQAESPVEINAIPDPTPATAPAGYDEFINQTRLKMYQKDAIENEVSQDIAQKEEQMMQLYQSNPAAEEFYTTMASKMDAAEQSGNTEKAESAAIARRMLEDDAEEIVQYFNDIPEEQHEELASSLLRRTIMRAKDEQSDNGYDYGDNAPWLEDLKIKNMHDDALGLVPTMKINTPDEIEGDGIDYLFYPSKSDHYVAYEANKAARDAGSDVRAKQDKAPVLEVTWEVQSDNPYKEAENRKKYSPGERKRLALNALKMWRQDVLPQLTPGTILRAEPTQTKEEQTPGSKVAGQNQRKRIYSLAGFGDRGYDRHIYGMVITDENGKNKVVPMFSREDEIEESFNQVYLDALMGDLNMLEEEIIYEMLFT